MKMLTNYGIIDHIGSIEETETLSKAYAKAYALLNSKDLKKVFTMSALCRHLNLSDKQKWLVRQEKNPKEVVLITTATEGSWFKNMENGKFEIDSDDYDYCRISAKTKAQCRQWIEKSTVEDFHLILVDNSNGTIETISSEDIEPKKEYAEDSIYRKCSAIWGRALGWTFSATLYNSGEDINTIVPSTGTKKFMTRRQYIKLSTVASEDECFKFFEHYKYLQQNDLLADNLEAGYSICPNCDRPVYETQEQCSYCDHVNMGYIELKKESYIDNYAI